MDYICIGKLVNTHGIKGEVRIISDFKYKNLVFNIGKDIYIGNKKEKFTINSYRIHKEYDMVTLNGINSIDDVLKYKGELVYILKDDIEIDGYFDEDLIGLNVYQNGQNKGIVEDLSVNKQYTLLVINYNNKKYLVPNIKEFVLNVDLENKKIEIVDMKGLLDEN